MMTSGIQANNLGRVLELLISTGVLPLIVLPLAISVAKRLESWLLGEDRKKLLTKRNERRALGNMIGDLIAGLFLLLILFSLIHTHVAEAKFEVIGLVYTLFYFAWTFILFIIAKKYSRVYRERHHSIYYEFSQYLRSDNKRLARLLVTEMTGAMLFIPLAIIVGILHLELQISQVTQVVVFTAAVAQITLVFRYNRDVSSLDSLSSLLEYDISLNHEVVVGDGSTDTLAGYIISQDNDMILVKPDGFPVMSVNIHSVVTVKPRVHTREGRSNFRVSVD